MSHAPKSAFSWKTLSWQLSISLIMGFAVWVRALNFGCGRALWIDEAMVSLNIIHASLPQLLLKPMLYYQVAPLGFLTVEKAIVSLFGSGEYSLRLFPFLCSLMGLLLFYRLSKKTKLSPIAFLIALAGFAASRGLVYYAGEVKQYASDVLVALSLLLLAYRVWEQPDRRKNILWLGLAGILAVWFAYPAFFILLGLGLALLILFWQQKDRRGVLYMLLCLLAWSGSMGLYFAVGLESIRASKAHQDIWQEIWDKQLASFMPPLYTLSGWQWIIKRTMDIFNYPVGIQSHGLAALMFLIGLVSMVFKRMKSNRPYLLLLVAPIAATQLASALHLYPFTGRLVLFLVPSYLLLMAAGLDTISARFKMPSAVITLLGFILIIPSLQIPKLYHPESEEIKPVLQYIQNHQQPNDILFVYYGAQPALTYYHDRYQLPPLLGADYQDYVNGMDRNAHHESVQPYVDRMLKTTHGKTIRLWFVLSHLQGQEGVEYLHVIGNQARLITSYRNKGAGAYLYEIPE